MRRKRARAVGHQVSLFPFLAVLICTMGVLIVLLVLVVKQADQVAKRSQQDSAEETAQKLDELQFEVESASFRVAELLEFRPQALQALQQHKLRRSHLEDHQRKLISELNALQDKWRALENQQSLQAVNAQQQLEQLQVEITQLRDELMGAREEAARRRSRTAVVAYDGRSGTHRRPIYIECTPSGIDLQPFDIHLTEEDFTDPVLPGNPLDAAILAIRERWQEQDPNQSQGTPYPLILVRPGGSMAYAIVRQAMKSWDSEFGHQIVPQQLELDFPNEDPQLGRELENVIASAKRRQARINASVASLTQRMQGGSGSGSGLSGISGGQGGQGAGSDFSGYGSGSSATGEEVVLRATGRRGGFVTEGDSSFGSQSPPSGNRGDSQQESDAAGSSDKQGSGVTAYQASQRTGSSGDRQGNAGGGAQAGNRADTGIAVPSQATEAGSNAPSIADSRGSNWALPTRTSGATAFRRPIKVSCLADRIILHGAEVERRRDLVLQFQPSVESVMDPMVEAIWDRIDSWGVAGFNSYWKPELQVSVYQGGEAAFRQLQDLLQDSGLGVSEATK